MYKYLSLNFFDLTWCNLTDFTFYLFSVSKLTFLSRKYLLRYKPSFVIKFPWFYMMKFFKIYFYVNGNLNNYFDFHVRLSIPFRFRSVRVSKNCQTATAEAKPRCVQSILKPHGQSSRLQSDRYRRGKAEVRIINFKTTWSEFQTPVRLLPELVPSSCVRWHT